MTLHRAPALRQQASTSCQIPRLIVATVLRLRVPEDSSVGRVLSLIDMEVHSWGLLAASFGAGKKRELGVYRANHALYQIKQLSSLKQGESPQSTVAEVGSRRNVPLPFQSCPCQQSLALHRRPARRPDISQA
jgi:hypothetical protein